MTVINAECYISIGSGVGGFSNGVKKQLAAGVLVQAGKWGDNGGMIVVKAESRGEADKIIDQDPLALAGLITFETAELHAAVAFK